MHKVIRESHTDDLTLIAEGDAVVARFNYRITLADGKKLSARTLAYYRLENGKIVKNDLIMAPELHNEIASLMTPPVGA